MKHWIKLYRELYHMSILQALLAAYKLRDLQAPEL